MRYFLVYNATKTAINGVSIYFIKLVLIAFNFKTNLTLFVRKNILDKMHFPNLYHNLDQHVNLNHHLTDA